MINRPLPIGIFMAVLAGIPLYLLALQDFQLNLRNFPLILGSLLVFFLATALWSATAARPEARSAPRAGRESGIVKWFNTSKGFGFISREKGGDLFVHFRSIRGQGHRVLMEGQKVEFGIVMGEKGEQAHDVEILR